jgi:hypothetical protein
MRQMTRIPRADTPGGLQVSDGTDAVGSIVVVGRKFFAFDVEHVFIGTYTSQREAMRSIPKLKKQTKLRVQMRRFDTGNGAEKR